MAIGDKAAAKGLVVYAATQDLRLGYQNDNQRGDDIADTMVRLDNAEKDARLPETIYTANLTQQTVPSGGTLGLGTVAVPAVKYARVLRVEWRALITDASTATATTVFLRNAAADQLQGDQTYGRGSVSGVMSVPVAANATASFQLVASPNGGPATVTGDSRFSQLRAVARTI